MNTVSGDTQIQQPGDHDLYRQVDQMIASHDYRSAISLLEEAGKTDQSSELSRRLIDLRIRAFPEMNWPEPSIDWPPEHDGRFDSVSGVPEVGADLFDAAVLRAGIIGKGGVIVRGLMDPATVTEMRNDIDLTLTARQSFEMSGPSGDTEYWYSRPPSVRGGPSGPAQSKAGASKQHSVTGSVWSVDSPPMALKLTQFYRDVGLPGILDEYFGEAAVLSVKKWVLRCIAPKNGSSAGWHQDGRFLGDPTIRTVNMWIALTDCGGDASAPGLELIAGNDGQIYETGTGNAAFDWTVGDTEVKEISKRHPVECPRFNAGDAIFFDHFNLHRTAFGLDHTENRYALESWFFAASRAPDKQQPLVF